MSEGNRLAHEASPYLRQHASDPVDWYPWGDAAFERARHEGKPLLLSIGYASCHWCHVMARESFRDPSVARLMNERFVNVKVDREERPDVDAVYMAAVQALTGHGGWPLTVALTPEGRPFYGGTYFPPEERPGVPSFTRVLNAVAEAWETRRRDVEASAAELTAALKRMEAALAADDVGPASDLAEQVVERLEALEDPHHGGFGAAPKFPPHETLRLLLAQPGERRLELALRVLRAMARGGIRDQLGGGFARYAVDAEWRVPHFEMMLYDNAAMLRNYATAYSRSGDHHLRDVAYGIVGWLQDALAFDPDADGRPLGARAPRRGGEGGGLPQEVGFFSALDADQQGQEGAYYVWTEAELREAAGADADLAVERFGVVTPGPFEGANVLRVAATSEALARRHGVPEAELRARLDALRERLRVARERRPAPAVDDKALASWNGLTLGALATAGRLLAEPEMLALARANARFIQARLWHEGRLWHMWRQGQRSVEGLLEDYAYVGLGLLELYRATFENEWLEWALELAAVVSERFHDPAGGYFSTAADMQRLLVRPKGYIDAATPSENAAGAELVWWAARYESDAARQRQAEAALAGISPAVLQAPQAFSSSLRVLLLMQGAPREVIFAGAPRSQALEELLAEWRRFDDGRALVLLLEGSTAWQAGLPLAEGRLPDPGAGGERVTAYVCRGGTCQLPAREPEAFLARLGEGGWEVATAIDTARGQR